MAAVSYCIPRINKVVSATAKIWLEMATFYKFSFLGVSRTKDKTKTLR